MTRFADLIDRLSDEASLCMACGIDQRTLDAGAISNLLSEAAAALEHDAMPKLITPCGTDPSYVEPLYDEGWRIVRSIDPDGPVVRLLWEGIA